MGRDLGAAGRGSLRYAVREPWRSGGGPSGGVGLRLRPDRCGIVVERRWAPSGCWLDAGPRYSHIPDLENIFPLPLWAWAAKRTKVRGRGSAQCTCEITPPPNLGPLRGPSPQGEGEIFLHCGNSCLPRDPSVPERMSSIRAYSRWLPTFYGQGGQNRDPLHRVKQAVDPAGDDWLRRKAMPIEVEAVTNGI